MFCVFCQGTFPASTLALNCVTELEGTDELNCGTAASLAISATIQTVSKWNYSHVPALIVDI
jgi:hypothetical protein